MRTRSTHIFVTRADVHRNAKIISTIEEAAHVRHGTPSLRLFRRDEPESQLVIERIRPTLAAIWKRSVGRSPLGAELTRRTGEVEDRVRAVVWSATTPLRRIEPVGHFLTWLSNVTKRAQPLPPAPRKTYLPDPKRR